MIPSAAAAVAGGVVVAEAVLRARVAEAAPTEARWAEQQFAAHVAAVPIVVRRVAPQSEAQKEIPPIEADPTTMAAPTIAEE
jgi:hypothetical protein